MDRQSNSARWTRASIFVGIWLTWCATGQAQEVVPVQPPAGAPAAAPATPPGGQPVLPPADAKPEVPPTITLTPAPEGTVIIEGSADGSGPGCEKKKEDKGQCGPMHVLANEPVRIFPPPGFPFQAPTGPGYYSLWDQLTGNYREKAPKFPYSPISIMPKSFFDADFRYLANPKNTQHEYSDFLHEIFFGPNNDFYFSTGGEVRNRYMNEINSRLSGINRSYDLLRTRVFGDLWYKDMFRVYVEYLDAQAFSERPPLAPFDRDRSDLLNAFIDVKVADIDNYPAYVRVGRQEMLLGSQRAISPLDWANTRRTFQGVRAFRQGEKFDADFFWVQPVIPDPSHFDSVADRTNFAGSWFTYRPQKGTFIDAYYLYLNDNEPSKVTFDVNTLGSRYYTKRGNVIVDLEGMLQLGSRPDQQIVAGAATAGAGYNFCQLPWNPTAYVYYDYASGNKHQGSGGTFSTFNQLYPFNHYYLGSMDLVGRQNIHDVQAHLYLYPTNWITFWGQYHHFLLDSGTDALYNSAGVAIRQSPKGTAGTYVGDELHFLVNFHLFAHNDLMVGYAHLFAGEFIRNTGPPVSPSLFYVQYSFRW
jgi:hypothetical protein